MQLPAAIKVFLINVYLPLKFPQFYWQTKSRVLCCDMLDDGTILAGTVSWYIHAFVLELRCEYILIILVEKLLLSFHFCFMN